MQIGEIRGNKKIQNMTLVSENTIDAVVESLETADFEAEVAILGDEQPALLAYVMSEEFELLTQDERELMLYIIIVLWRSVERHKGAALDPLPDEESGYKHSINALEDAEERNWERLDTVTLKHFRDRMTVFFDGYGQEDLLAFVEDTLVEDDDTIVSKEGREPMFVALKSVIDIICQ